MTTVCVQSQSVCEKKPQSYVQMARMLTITSMVLAYDKSQPTGRDLWTFMLTLTVPVTAIDALQHFETG